MPARCPPPPGENGKRIRELTRIVQKRFGFEDNTVELFAERVAEKGLCAQAQAEALKYAPVGVVCGFDFGFWVCCRCVPVRDLAGVVPPRAG